MRLFLSKGEIEILRNLACERLIAIRTANNYASLGEAPLKTEGSTQFYEEDSGYRALIDKLDRYGGLT